jgi:2-polyprenyl-6-methoxyphenol hydroxylase-like FAD-dependent oxidoreductase
MKATAIIVGGGLSGLSSAIALHRAGWQVKLLERAPAFGEVGAGISLWPNSLRALDLLGVGDKVRALGGVEATAGFRYKSGKWLFRSDIEAIEQRYGQTILIHRADLIDILSSALPKEVVTLGAEVQNIVADKNGVTVTHIKGTDRADLLVAGDGIRSLTRTKFWPEASAPKYAGYTTYRFIAPLIDTMPEASETWGSGERVGIFPFHDGRIYSYLTASVPEGIKPENAHAELVRRFSSWHEPIPTMLKSVDPTTILHHDIYRAPKLKTYVKGRVVLVGDAAHAMTPDFGQGGGTSLEDGVELANALSKATDIAGGLKEYDEIRRPRTQSIAQQSALFGKVAQWSWPPLVVLRNFVMSILPPAVLLNSIKPMLSWKMEQKDR